MTDDEFAAIKSRYAALSAIVRARGQSFHTADGRLDTMTPDEGAAFFAQMIAVCAEDMPALLAEVERQQAYIERLHAHRAAVITDHEAYHDGLEAENVALREIVRAVADGETLFLDAPRRRLIEQARAVLEGTQP